MNRWAASTCAWLLARCECGKLTPDVVPEPLQTGGSRLVILSVDIKDLDRERSPYQILGTIWMYTHTTSHFWSWCMSRGGILPRKNIPCLLLMLQKSPVEVSSLSHLRGFSTILPVGKLAGFQLFQPANISRQKLNGRGPLEAEFFRFFFPVGWMFFNDRSEKSYQICAPTKMVYDVGFEIKQLRWWLVMAIFCWCDSACCSWSFVLHFANWWNHWPISTVEKLLIGHFQKVPGRNVWPILPQKTARRIKEYRYTTRWWKNSGSWINSGG